MSPSGVWCLTEPACPAKLMAAVGGSWVLGRDLEHISEGLPLMEAPGNVWSPCPGPQQRRKGGSKRLFRKIAL